MTPIPVFLPTRRWRSRSLTRTVPHIYRVTIANDGTPTIEKKELKEADTAYVEAYKVVTKAATLTEPAAYQYHLMNTSSIERKVILRKVAENTYASLKDAKFRIFRADLTEVTEDRLAAGYYQSESSGIYFIGKLPLGKYYLVETGAPTVTGDTNPYTGNIGKVFVLSVTSDGAMQKELGKTVTGDPSSNGTLLTQTAGGTESVKIFAAEGPKDLITVFKEWILSLTEF